MSAAAHPDDGGFADPRSAQHRHLGVVDGLGRRVPELRLPRGYRHGGAAVDLRSHASSAIFI